MADSSADSPFHDLERITRFFERQKFDYLLIGGAALSLWGRPRMTLDFDFLILVEEADLEKLQRLALKEKFKIDREWLKWNPLLKHSQIRVQVGKTHVDLLLPRDNHDREAFKRKRRKRFRNRVYPFISPEDFILQKLKVGRPRDFEDALSVLERQSGELGRTYLKKWAKKLGITEELNYLLRL